MITENGLWDNPHWSDDFRLTKEQRKRIDELYKEFLIEAADVCRLDTSEWNSDDYETLEDIIIFN